MTRDYYPEFRVVVGDKPYDVETIPIFTVGLHDPQVHNREQAVELVCRDLLEQGAERLVAASTRNGLTVTCQMRNNQGGVPKPLLTPTGLTLQGSAAITSDTWTTTQEYIFIEDINVFKTLYRSARKPL